MWRTVFARTVICIATVLGGPGDSYAQRLTVCPLEEAVKQIQNYSVQLNASLADQGTPLMQQLKALNEKGAAHPDRPIKESLTPAERNRFQELRYQLLRLQAQKIPTSGYLRDAKVIAKLTDVAYAASQGRIYDQSDPDFFYWSVLFLLRTQNDSSDITPTIPVNPEQCTIEAGLHFYEQLMLSQIDHLAQQFQDATARTTSTAQKYHLDMKQEGWIERIPTESDKKAARVDNVTLKHGVSMLTFVKDIENLKFLNHVMLLGAQSDMDDLAQAQNEEQLSKFGSSFLTKLKSYDQHTQNIAALVNMIEQKVPSDSFIETQGLTQRLHEQGLVP